MRLRRVVLETITTSDFTASKKECPFRILSNDGIRYYTENDFIRIKISPMNLTRIVLVAVTALAFHTGAAQEKEKHRTVITYDPLFWKDKLNLNPHQSQRIRDINSQYYDQLLATFREDRANRAVLNNKVNESLTARSEEIWNTLYPRQRRKWEKILSENYIN